MKFLNRKDAAVRVGKNLSTIYRWEERGLLAFTLDLCREDQLLEAAKKSSAQVGRPRAARRKA
ncbi:MULTISPECIES: hypothetical protein [Cryobacterium]|uniref:hypothetical protein n=1 Tax=Cryobacterium TaxID=69578 RepID=UPI000CD486F9|nr:MULTISPECIES: hypothetical protein [Cryobacterium]POH63621.1 hypothetical protein C3B60_16005 [Cryobacterium zongtaii]TFC45590.1 hypothetical protein E3O57_08080 [Cryobacterium sp. TMN-39-2]